MSKKEYAKRFAELRNSYYDLEMGGEKIWIKKLRNILESDIHQKPLGCKISNTHVKIGEIHLDTFYEAQILFSHPRWINRFSEWLLEEICNHTKEESKILIIGYETYIEPVLVSLKENIVIKNRQADYCVYEEPKYIRSEEKSEQKIRYLRKFISKKKDIEAYKKIVFVCGISSTLNTFYKMKTKLLQEIGNTGEIEIQYCSLIHVLPKVSQSEDSGVEHKFTINASEAKFLTWNCKQKQAKLQIGAEEYCAPYLVSVECTWHQADSCKLCFPENPIEERPIIATSETSVIPIQMINKVNDNANEQRADEKGAFPEINEAPIDFFRSKPGGGYLYNDYLYYNHIDRDDHHYKYYVRTGNLFHDIYYCRNNSFAKEQKKFKTFCSNIKKRLNKKNDPNVNVLDVIIAPSHFSNELFPNAINQHVFDGNAHVIAFDPKKEFRSNFGTKYSNLEYFLEQVKDRETKAQVRFHFVDDQIVTGSTFFRAKSLLYSLMRGDSKQVPNNIIIFDQVITMVSRISEQTKKDYVSDESNYHALIEFAVPSIRNYGDSCPSCNIRYKAQDILESAALSIVAKYWSTKHYNYRVKSLKEAKSEAEKNDDVKRARQFRRFEFENKLWKEKKHCYTTEEYIKIISELLSKKGNKFEEQFENAIALLKAITSPFLYYKEEIKKAALKINVSIINYIVENKEACITDELQVEIKCGNKEVCSIKIDSPKEEEMTEITLTKIALLKYNFVNVLINCLAQIESTYILDTERIIKLCDLMKQLSGQKDGWKKYKDNSDGYYTILLNAYKRIICGIAGEQRNECFRKEILEYICDESNNKHKDLFVAMYLESITKGKKLDGIANRNTQKDNSPSVLEKYHNVCCKLKQVAEDAIKTKQDENRAIQSIKLYYKDKSMNCSEDEIWYIIADGNKEAVKDGYALRNSIIKDDQQQDSLNKIGYCEADNNEEGCKYIFDLIHYTDEYQQDNEDRARQPYVEITFTNGVKKHDRYSALRKLLTHKYALAQMLSEDIEKGAVKSAIQAKATELLLAHRKTQSHASDAGLVRDNEEIAKVADNHMDNIEAIKLLARMYMNDLIGLGNTILIHKYFYDANTCRPSPFLFYFMPVSLNEKEIFKNYLKSLQAKNNEITINITETDNKKELDIDAFIERMNLIPFFVSGVDKGQVICHLIGIIETFIDNAKRHSKSKIDLKLQMEPSKYIISVENEISNKVENEISDSTRKDTGGITKRFFVEYISEGDSCISMGRKKSNTHYIAKISINNKMEA